LVSKYVRFNLHYVELTRHYLSSKNQIVKVKFHYVMLKFHYLKITISYVKPKQHYVKWPRDYDRLKLHYELSVFTEMLGRWVVPFKNYVRQFHPISKMATTGEHSLTFDTMGNYFKNLLIRNYLANWNQTVKMVLMWSPAKLCPTF
jgi:hypothetical protein